MHDVEDHGPPFDSAAPSAEVAPEFLKLCADFGLVIEPAELARYARYLGLLADANTRFNLTAVKDVAAMWERHIFDSLTLLPVIEAAAPSAERTGQRSLLDVGSGGGLPGIPLAIALPDLRVTLLEATGKKARFLEAVTAELALSNVRVVHARAEEAGRDREAHREGYDFVVSRAVGTLPTLLELTVPFACVGGLVLSIKGERAAEEIASAKGALYKLHAHALEPIKTPTGTIVPIQKMRISPKMYPRRAGEPKRDPLS